MGGGASWPPISGTLAMPCGECASPSSSRLSVQTNRQIGLRVDAMAFDREIGRHLDVSGLRVSVSGRSADQPLDTSAPRQTCRAENHCGGDQSLNNFVASGVTPEAAPDLVACDTVRWCTRS